MRVTTWVDISQEVEVDVSVADVLSSISALTDSDQLPMILDCINRCHSILREIPDQRIAAMTDKQRKIIAEALHVQAGRYESYSEDP